MGQVIDLAEYFQRDLGAHVAADDAKKAKRAEWVALVKPKVLLAMQRVTFTVLRIERHKGKFKAVLLANVDGQRCSVFATVATARPLDWDKAYSWPEVVGMKHWVRVYVAGDVLNLNGGKL